MRQRLLENNKLTVNKAFKRNRALYQAHEYSPIYTSENDLVIDYTRHESEAADLGAASINGIVAITASNNLKVLFCGRTYHRRSLCLAREIACYFCGNFLHFFRVCIGKIARFNKKNFDGQFNSLTAQGPTPVLRFTWPHVLPANNAMQGL